METTFKAYLHNGGGEMITIIVKDNVESINNAEPVNSYLWDLSNGHNGYEVDDDIEIPLEKALEKFSIYESFDMSNSFERILKEARDYAAEPAAETKSSKFGVAEAKVFLVWKGSPQNAVSPSFNSREEAEQYAKTLEKEENLNEISRLTGGKFSRKTCEAFLEAFEKLNK